jgi:RND family efflux transporter MFP subunit
MWHYPNLVRGLFILAGMSFVAGGLDAGDPKPGRVVLEMKGYVVPVRQTTVSPRVAGPLVEVMIKEGQRVKKDEALARLDPADGIAAVRVVQAEVKVAAAKLAKAREGKSKGDVNIAQAEVELAEARLLRAQHHLNRTVVIASPINGTVLKIYADVGTMLDPKSFQTPAKFCDIADLETMDVEVWVGQNDIEKIAKTQSCLVRLEGFAGATYRGTVARVAPIADRAKGALEVRVRLDVPKNDRRLRPEMSAVVQFLAKE